MLFNFKLKSPLECAGLEDAETRENYVCWFYLTDSEYFIDLGEVKLFQSSSQWIEKYIDEWPLGIEFVDYQYSRQLEDLFEILPTIACPIPSSLYELIDTDEKRDSLYDKIVTAWEDKCGNTGQWNDVDEKYDNIVRNLIYYGSLDSGYLRFRTDCQFFNVDGRIIIRYNFIDKDECGCPVWSAGKGKYTLTYSEFVYDIEDLLSRFFTAMDKQVEASMRIFSVKSLDRANLISENVRRKDYFYGILNSIKNGEYDKQIDWQSIRDDLDCILDGSGVG